MVYKGLYGLKKGWPNESQRFAGFFRGFIRVVRLWGFGFGAIFPIFERLRAQNRLHRSEACMLETRIFERGGLRIWYEM